MMIKKKTSILLLGVLAFCIAPTIALKSLGVPINGSQIFFDSDGAPGADIEFEKTRNSRLKPIAFYPQLFDGKKGRTDVVYFWAERSPLCVHLYLKKMILLKSVSIYLQERQMNNVNSTTGILTDGVSGSVRNLVLNTSDEENQTGRRILRPVCSVASPMTITDRVRLCWNLKSINQWFGLIEIELHGSTEVSADPNIVRYRTIRSQMDRCSAYQVIKFPQKDRKINELRQWQVLFERAFKVSSLQMLVVLPTTKDSLDGADWAKLRLNNGSTVGIGTARSCSWSEPKDELSPPEKGFRWRKVSCAVQLSPALSLSLQDGLRAARLRVLGQSYSKFIDRYPQPVLEQKVNEEFSRVKLNCSLANCRYLRLKMFDKGRGFVPVIVDGRVQSDTPLQPKALSVSMSDKVLIVNMPYDFTHAGKFQCECVWAEDNSILLSNVAEIKIEPEKMLPARLRETALARYNFEYKFSWDSHYDYKKTNESFILFDPEENKVVTFRMRILSFINGSSNGSIAFDSRETVQPRRTEICRVAGNRFCVPGFEFLQPVQYRRVESTLRYINIPVWIGFLNEWTNQTIHLHKKGLFDFWVTQTGDSRLLVDIFCTPGSRCSGNITKVSPCSSKSSSTDVTTIKVGHNDRVVIDDINARSGYRLCLFSEGGICAPPKNTSCGKCVDINAELMTMSQTVRDLVTVTCKESGYSRFDEEGKPTKTKIVVSFQYNAILRCANVGLTKAVILCEDGFQFSRNWTGKRLRLRSFFVPDVPMETSCHVKLYMRSFNNETEIISTTVVTKQSPLTPFKIKERRNSTHAILQWYSDPSKFRKGYLKTYRILMTTKTCSGKTKTSKLDQEKTVFAFPVERTKRYVVTVVRLVNFNNSVASVPSLKFKFVGLPEQVEPPEIVDMVPINRWSFEAFIDFKNLSHCTPNDVKVLLGDEILKAKLSKTYGELIALVNSSAVPPLSTVPVKVRGSFEGLVESPWSSSYNYTVPMEMAIATGNAMKLSNVSYTVRQGSSEKFLCRCMTECPEGISFSWYRGSKDGSLISSSQTLEISDAKPTNSGRYVCLYNVTGSTGPRTEGVASTIILTVKPHAGATTNRDNAAQSSGPKVFLALLSLLSLLNLLAAC